VKTIINFSKKIHLFKVSVAFLTCLFFLILPSCQKDESDQDSLLNMDNMSSSSSPKNGKISYGKVKDIDGNVYKTVKIGKQWWMAENLKTTSLNDRTLLSNVDDNTAWTSLSSGAYCWYNNDASTYKLTYGALYNWYAVNTGKLCPNGWHVPSDLEWHTLILYLDPAAVLDFWESDIAADKLKEVGTVHWNNTSTNSTNETGFTALPGGFRRYEGTFLSIGGYGDWWTSTEPDIINAWRRFMGISGIVFRDNLSKNYGLSVRCMKDK
jgi:uncharacterized protein (TIGR02145 family)